MYWQYWTASWEGQRARPSFAHQGRTGWWHGSMEAARVGRGPQPTFVWVHTSDSPSGTRVHPRARTSATFACLRAFISRALLHNVRAGSAALRASVSSALGDTAALSVGLVILSPVRPIQPSYEPRRAHLRHAHRHARPHTRIPCRSGATRALAGVAPSSDAVVLAVATCLLMHER